jgi:hypothetical protein
MNDGQPLPNMQYQVLDDATVARLRDDIAQLTQVLEVKTRDSGAISCTDPAAAIAEAFAKLLAGQTRGVQVRYCHEGQTWWDTLMPTATGIRLTRVCVDELTTFEATPSPG